MLSADEIREIEHELEAMPDRRSGCIEALKTVQRHRGWVDDGAIHEIADFLGISSEEVDGVATFYNLIFRRPVGRHVVLVCDSVSCWIMGCDKVRRAFGETVGVDFGETTPDDRFTVLPVPCLGTCDHAPALMVDDDLHQDVDPERLGEILNRYD